MSVSSLHRYCNSRDSSLVLFTGSIIQGIVPSYYTVTLVNKNIVEVIVHFIGIINLGIVPSLILRQKRSDSSLLSVSYKNIALFVIVHKFVFYLSIKTLSTDRGNVRSLGNIITGIVPLLYFI